MFEKKFLEATVERAIKTFGQTFLALVGAGSADIISASALDSAQVALGAALLSILTSFGSSKVGTAGPSLAGETVEKLLPVVTQQLSKVVEEEVIAPAQKRAATRKKPAAKK